MNDVDNLINDLRVNDVNDNVFTNEDDVETYAILDKLNAVLDYLKQHPYMKGTTIKVNGVAQDVIEVVDDIQNQLDILESDINTLDSNKAPLDAVTQLVDSLADIDLKKQDYFTYKYEGELIVNDIDDFRTKVYEQRKNTVRKWQLEINPYNLDLMSVLGYPDNGISSADKAFLYIELPYSEAGGFEIDLKLMKRDGSRIFNRNMSSTLNSKWHDTGWTNVSTPLANKSDITDLITKGNESWGMVPDYENRIMNTVDKPYINNDFENTFGTGYFALFVLPKTKGIEYRISLINSNPHKIVGGYRMGAQSYNAFLLPSSLGDKFHVDGLSGTTETDYYSIYYDFIYAKKVVL